MLELLLADETPGSQYPFLELLVSRLAGFAALNTEVRGTLLSKLLRRLANLDFWGAIPICAGLLDSMLSKDLILKFRSHFSPSVSDLLRQSQVQMDIISSCSYFATLLISLSQIAVLFSSVALRNVLAYLSLKPLVHHLAFVPIGASLTRALAALVTLLGATSSMKQPFDGFH